MKPRPSMIPDEMFGVGGALYLIDTGEWYGQWIAVTEALTPDNQNDIIKECKRLLIEALGMTVTKVMKSLPPGHDSYGWGQMFCRHDGRDLAEIATQWEIKLPETGNVS